jgi:hypothetical protein
MKLSENFKCGEEEWRCTDIGSRVITAIHLNSTLKDNSWFNGPPYAVIESVFDEYDQPGCEIMQTK